VVGSSRKITSAGRPGSRRGPAAAHAAGVGLGRPVGGLGEVEPVQQLLGPRLGGSTALVEQLADEDQVLGAGQVLVHGGVLPGEADVLPHLTRLGEHVEPVDPGGPGVGADEGGQNPHRSGLAGAVGAEDAENRALTGRQVDAGQRLRGAETFREAFGFDGECHRSSSLSDHD
jgi:hypothetical protein